MHLQEITLRGFKSFAHTTTFAIGRGLTAVVGPNGSGKSNFTEAIRWVLGEQSLKSLRGRKSEDVIFAGSARHTQGGAAVVTLTLNNEDGRFPLAAPEVALTRRLTRAGESEYLLNGDPVRLLDIQQLLAEVGMGTKSYTVISQGMVDRYLTASPAARRELFDEACGIKPLQLKLARAQRQLSAAYTESRTLEITMRELEPRLRLLRRQAKQHEEYTELARTFAKTQTQWLHHRWHSCRHTFVEVETARAAAQAHLADTRKARDTVEQSLLTMAQQPTAARNADTRMQLTERVAQEEAEYQRQQNHFSAQQRAREELAVSLRSLRVQIARAEAELAQARAAVGGQPYFRAVNDVLVRCNALLQNTLAGRAPSAEEAAVLRADIAALHAQTNSDAGMVTIAQTLLGHLEGPLQAVARLRALEQDRASRLAQWQEEAAPSPAARDAARAALEAHDATTGAGTQTHESWEQRLAQARETELAAERAATHAEDAYTRAQQELQAAENAVLRERGTAGLDEIKSSPPTGAAPAEEAVQALAARVAHLGAVDPLVLQEYEEVRARWERIAAQLADIHETAEKIQRLVTSVTREMHTKFRTQFAVITRAFTEYFSRLFDGGEAKLVIVDAPANEEVAESGENPSPSVEGVEIFVHPPGKKLQHVQLLSGGEKALTSLALLLAILEVQQPPFLVLDEVDAALDEANSHRFASLLKEKSAQTQCVVVSHNRETMAQADTLYGITMQQDGVSKVYSVKLRELVGDASPHEMPV